MKQRKWLLYYKQSELKKTRSWAMVRPAKDKNQAPIHFGKVLGRVVIEFKAPPTTLQFKRKQ